jgi:hypothetical protein
LCSESCVSVCRLHVTKVYLCECLQTACYKIVLVCMCIWLLILTVCTVRAYSAKLITFVIKRKHKLPDVAEIIRLNLCRLHSSQSVPVSILSCQLPICHICDSDCNYME